MNRDTRINRKARGRILQIIDHLSPEGVTEEGIEERLNEMGKPQYGDSLDKHLAYLAGKQYCRVQDLTHAATDVKRRVWTVCPQGVDLLEGNNGLTDEGVEIGWR